MTTLPVYGSLAVDQPPLERVPRRADDRARLRREDLKTEARSIGDG
jgi:hypothetical protein